MNVLVHSEYGILNFYCNTPSIHFFIYELLQYLFSFTLTKIGYQFNFTTRQIDQFYRVN